MIIFINSKNFVFLKTAIFYGYVYVCMYFIVEQEQKGRRKSAGRRNGRGRGGG